MPLEVAIRNRLAVCALALMLAPWGMAVPLTVNGALAEAESDIVELDDAQLSTDMPSASSGTISFPPRPTSRAHGNR